MGLNMAGDIMAEMIMAEFLKNAILCMIMTLKQFGGNE